jgi:hypothetical protein
MLCEQRYRWRYEYGLIPNQSSYYLSVGSFFHEGVDHLLSEGCTLPALEEAKELLMEKEVDDNDWEALLTSIWMLERYQEFWDTEGNPWVEVVSTEETMGFPLLNEELWIFGKVDGLVRDSAGHLWLLEHKTSYSVDREYIEKVELDGQITLYMLLVMEVFGEVPDGVIYNVVCRPRKYRRNDESIEGYLARNLEEWRLTPRSYMDRQIAFRSPESLEELRQQLIHTYYRIKSARDEESWLMNTGVCYLRQRKCPYTRLCKEGMRPDILAMFHQEDPHPELNLDDALVPDYFDGRTTTLGAE